MAYDFDKLIPRGTTRSAKWANPELLPLWVADMDFESPPAVYEAISARAAHNLYGYDRLPENYFPAVQSWFKTRQGYEVQEDWLVATSGVVGALHLAVQSLTLPGDEVVIQPPVYHPFPRAILNSGRQLVTSPLKRVHEHYEIDFDDLEAQFARRRAKLFILCNPHNPIGKVYSREELKTIGDLALKHGVVVVSDEIHGDLILPGNQLTPFASLGGDYLSNSVIATAPSKTFNLAGLATSNIFIANPVLRDQFARFSEGLGLHGGSLYGFIACEAAYRSGAQWLDELLVYLKANADLVQSFLKAELPEIKADELQGSYLQWVDFGALGLGDEALEALLRDKAKLWVSPGIQFGEGGSGFIRLNLATQRSRLETALTRIKAAVKGQ
ncbi:MAG: pyridoxal phosphate-dependent aminotransferase [Christensenellaceae bacterium]|jgi:cystathionine beta-lyase|nr:pyridoxal phosphate-dependent aminotransferase [Christensenellaceae bacterium]